MKAPLFRRPLTKREAGIAFPPSTTFAVKKVKVGKPLQMSKSPEKVEQRRQDNIISLARRSLSRLLGRSITPQEVLAAERKICFDKRGKVVLSPRVLRRSPHYIEILKKNL